MHVWRTSELPSLRLRDLQTGNTGWLLQILLGAMAFTVLIYKRQTETPRRSWKIWCVGPYHHLEVLLLREHHLVQDTVHHLAGSDAQYASE